jgi:hypothetical protein
VRKGQKCRSKMPALMKNSWFDLGTESGFFPALQHFARRRTPSSARSYPLISTHASADASSRTHWPNSASARTLIAPFSPPVVRGRPFRGCAFPRLICHSVSALAPLLDQLLVKRKTMPSFALYDSSSACN